MRDPPKRLSHKPGIVESSTSLSQLDHYPNSPWIESFSLTPHPHAIAIGSRACLQGIFGVAQHTAIQIHPHLPIYMPLRSNRVRL